MDERRRPGRQHTGEAVTYAALAGALAGFGAATAVLRGDGWFGVVVMAAGVALMWLAVSARWVPRAGTRVVYRDGDPARGRALLDLAGCFAAAGCSLFVLLSVLG